MLFYFYRNYMIENQKIYEPSEGKEDVFEETMRILKDEEKIVMGKIKKLKQKNQMITAG